MKLNSSQRSLVQTIVRLVELRSAQDPCCLGTPNGGGHVHHKVGDCQSVQLRCAPNRYLEVHHFAPQNPNKFVPREITHETLHEERLRNTQTSAMGQESTRQKQLTKLTSSLTVLFLGKQRPLNGQTRKQSSGDATSALS